MDKIFVMLKILPFYVFNFACKKILIRIFGANPTGHLDSYFVEIRTRAFLYFQQNENKSMMMEFFCDLSYELKIFMKHFTLTS